MKLLIIPKKNYGFIGQNGARTACHSERVLASTYVKSTKGRF